MNNIKRIEIIIGLEVQINAVNRLAVLADEDFLSVAASFLRREAKRLGRIKAAHESNLQ